MQLGHAVNAASWDDALARRAARRCTGTPGAAIRINAYIDWVGDQVEARHGIDLVHVKLTDTAEAVARVVAEKAAGTTEGGAVDLIWINGENFASMKAQDLLFGPFAEDLPNFRYVDTQGKPTTLVDFTVPTDGLEAPWGMAQFVLFYDTATIGEPPRSIPACSNGSRRTPDGSPIRRRPTSSAAPSKHVLIELTDQPEALQHPVDQADFAAVTAPLWAWLEEARPHLWRKGASYPLSGPALHQLLDDGEVDFSLAFNPAEASAAISAPTARDGAHLHPRGRHHRQHPLRRDPVQRRPPSRRHGGRRLPDVARGPGAQAGPTRWGDGTVLDIDALAPEDRARFDALPLGVATLPPDR